jgi:glutamine---fructose-6-phosphate transaminase (isomerizing)
MNLTEKEIFSQYQALKETYRYILDNADKIKNLWDKGNFKSITFVGCGSGYSLCKSGEISSKLALPCASNSIAGGDLLMNFPAYKGLLKDSLLIVPSRSGNTSEVVKAIKAVREQLGNSCISICAVEGADMAGLSDINLEIPWAFDASVCQTRTVTNLYMANLLLVGIMSSNKSLLEEIKIAIENGQKFIEDNTERLMKISQGSTWNKVVVLADCELQGIGSEGALAFKEISMLQSNFHHILDVRHGPMVMIDDRTLVIIGCSPYEAEYQRDLIVDIKKKGALVVTVSSHENNDLGSDFNISIPVYKNGGVAGIPFIFVPQAISYFKALENGIDSDNPPGLDPWIKL